MRHLIVAGGKRVADGGPVRALGDRHLQAVFFEKAFFRANDERRAIGKGDDPATQLGGFRRIARIGGADPALGQAAEKRGEAEALHSLAEEVAAVQFRK